MAVRYARRWLKLTLRILGILLALVAFPLIALLIFGSELRDPVVRYLAAYSGRPIRVDGPFHAHLFCLHPRLVAERVTISNPPWTPPGVTAVIGRLSVTYDLPLFSQSFGIRRLEMEQATLYLSRDEAGRANWQFRDPDKGLSGGPPLIRSLRMPNARVQLDDQRRHLKFQGTLSAQDAPEQGPATALRVDGDGQLNGRPANFTLSGDPLATVSREKPYRFEFSETSSGAQLTGQGVVPHPFDFRVLETTFDSVGEDMRDLYFLTGVHLPDTGRYHLSGKLARHNRHFEFTDLDASSGRSDVRGSVSIESKMYTPSHVEADLRSKLLRISDLGARAAGRAPQRADAKGQNGKHVIPDKELQLTGTRKSDAVIHFHAQTLQAGRLALHSAAAKVKIDRGVIVAAPLSAALHEGKITGQLTVDASGDVPLADLDFRATDIPLRQLDPKGSERQPPVDGPLQARISLKGRGGSLHELAASATGTLTAVLPHGEVRSSLAELAGLDLRGLGLLAVGNKKDTGIRCGVASFEARKGTLTAQRLLLDTEPVVITGEGTIDLDSEALDLRFQGRPKHPTVRVRSALLVRGTLARPSLNIEAGKPVAQVGGAIALGMLLTPVAAMLAFVDPGLAKDADCAALLAQVKSPAARATQRAPN